jgi:hypothetical protein
MTACETSGDDGNGEADGAGCGPGGPPGDMNGATSAAEPESSDSLKAFGEVVKAFRKRARLTHEQGRRFPPAAFVDRAEEVLDAFGALRGAARHLSRRPGLASWFRQWAQLEAESVNLYTYECRLIPGLLQTEAYARTLFSERLPPLGDDQIEAMLSARTERQRLLRERPNTAFSFIVEEHVLQRGVGASPELLHHLLELAALRNIEVQVMPQKRVIHAGIDGPIRLLETPDNKWYGYCEGQESGRFISDPKVVSMLQMRYARMRSQALSLEESLSLLRRMRGAT